MAGITTNVTTSAARLAEARCQTLLRVIRPLGCQGYAIVDASIDDALHDVLQAEPPASEVTCLYDGAPAIRYARYAPYMLRLHEGSPVFQRWLRQGWQAHWGVFLASPQGTVVVKRHLKRFLRAKDPRGVSIMLRFYDPRVLPALLASLNPGHLDEWFGGGRVAACYVPLGNDLWCGLPQRGMLDRIGGATRLRTRILEITPQ